MNEFNNRIATQRTILKIVNSRINSAEALMGLSSDAINRWIQRNSIDPSGELSQLLFKAAKKLFFLANKSQEQITDNYLALSKEVDILINQIRVSAQQYS